MSQKFKCEITETSRDIIARLYLHNLIFIVPPHRGIGLQSFTNEEELRTLIKKILCEHVDKMEVELKNER